MISFIVVFTLGIVQAFYRSTGILQFITWYPGSFFLQKDGWLKKGEDQHFNCLTNQEMIEEGFHMKYIVETEKTVEQAVVDLQAGLELNFDRLERTLTVIKR